MAAIGQPHAPPCDSLTEDELESKAFKSFNTSKAGPYKFFSGVCEPDTRPANLISNAELKTHPIRFQKQYLKQSQLYGVDLLTNAKLTERQKLKRRKEDFEEIFQDKEPEEELEAPPVVLEEKDIAQPGRAEEEESIKSIFEVFDRFVIRAHAQWK